MKKTYKNPTLEVIKIQTQKMLAESAPLSNTEVNEGLGREDEDFEW